MITLYLRTEFEAALIEALAMFRTTDEGGNPIWRTASHTHALDVIGTLYTRPSDPEETPVAKEGYHANLRLFGDGESLAADIPAEIIVDPEPATPDRVWA